MLFHKIRSKTMGLAMAFIIVMMTVATFAAVQVEASGPAPTPKTQTQTNDVSKVKTNVATAADEMGSALTAETAAKVIEDKEMSGSSTTFLEKNPELAAVRAAKVIEQQGAANDVANVATALDEGDSALIAETAAKVREDKEMSPYSTTILEENPELATVMAAKVMGQQRAANDVANSILPGGEHWMTVADPLGRDFQLASHYLLHQDYPAAATEIREGAKFLKAEETALEQEVPEAGFARDLAVRSSTIDQLMRLADRVERGQASIKDLDAAMAKAYQVDLEHGVSRLMF